MQSWLWAWLKGRLFGVGFATLGLSRLTCLRIVDHAPTRNLKVPSLQDSSHYLTRVRSRVVYWHNGSFLMGFHTKEEIRPSAPVLYQCFCTVDLFHSAE